VVERGLGDVGPLGDVLQVHPLVAVLGQQFRRGADDLGLAAVASAGNPTGGPGGRGRHWLSH
jgi:hypothetical protein